MTQEANYDSEKSTVSLRQYVEKLISESDKRNEAQFQAAKEAVAAALAAAEKAVSAALVAQDKLTSAAFVAAKEALAEAQVQLTLYKAQSNEWRSTLNDLMAKMMMRQEVEMLFKGVETRVATLEGLSQRATGQAEAAGIGQQSNRWTFEKILTILALLIAAGSFLVHFSGK